MSGFFLSMIGKGDTRNHIVFEGNSFFDQTTGIDQIGSIPVTTAIETILAGTFDYINYSTHGYYMSLILTLTDRLASALSNRNENRFKDIVCVCELVNEIVIQINTGHGLSEVVEPMFTYGRLCTAKGFKFVFNTATPRSDSSTPIGYEDLRQNPINKLDNSTVNGYLRTIFNVPTTKNLIFTSNHIGYENMLLVDLGSSNFGQAGDSDDLAKYVDKVHPTITVSNQIAQMYVDAFSIAY